MAEKEKTHQEKQEEVRLKRREEINAQIEMYLRNFWKILPALAVIILFLIAIMK